MSSSIFGAAKIKINNMEILQKASTKSLGIIIDQNLNRKEHTELPVLANKVAKNLNIIRHCEVYNNNKRSF